MDRDIYNEMKERMEFREGDGKTEMNPYGALLNKVSPPERMEPIVTKDSLWEGKLELIIDADAATVIGTTTNRGEISEIAESITEIAGVHITGEPVLDQIETEGLKPSCSLACDIPPRKDKVFAWFRGADIRGGTQITGAKKRLRRS